MPSSPLESQYLDSSILGSIQWGAKLSPISRMALLLVATALDFQLQWAGMLLLVLERL